MKKIKAFFFILFKSATSPGYYKDLQHVSLKFSIKYLLVLATFASILIAAKTGPQIARDITDEFGRFTTSATEIFPEDLIITIQNGELTMNRSDPYIIEDFLVVDPEGKIEDMETYGVPILINKSNILVTEENRIQVYPLKDLPDSQVTRSEIIGLAEKIGGYLRYLPYVLVVLIFAAALLYYFGIRLIYLFLVAGLVMMVGRSRGLVLKFPRYYQIALHAMTLPLLAEIVISFTGLSIGIPMWFFGLNLLMAVAAVIGIDS